MAGAVWSVDVTLDQRALDRFLGSSTGAVSELLASIGRQVAARAQDQAPVSAKGSRGRAPGYLKSKIGWMVGHTSGGLHVDIVSAARTGDGREAPYGLFQSLAELHGAHGGRIRTTPHLQPALREVIGSL